VIEEFFKVHHRGGRSSGHGWRGGDVAMVGMERRVDVGTLDLTAHVGGGIAARRYPTQVAPRTLESFYISDLATLRHEAKRVRDRPDNFADRLRFRFIKAYVQTDDGQTFRVRLSSRIRQVWSAG
jgi:hypothetical protein